jgi:ribonuclease P protein component
MFFIAVLFKNAKPTGTPFFVARYSPEPKNSQFAVIAPKTIAKTAVARNSLRRKWYGSLQIVLKTLENTGPKPGIYAFILKKEGMLVAPKDREQALKAYFSR